MKWLALVCVALTVSAVVVIGDVVDKASADPPADVAADKAVSSDGAPVNCPGFCRSPHFHFYPLCRSCASAVPADGVKAVAEEPVSAASDKDENKEEGFDGECPFWCRERMWEPECRRRCGGGGPPGGECPWYCRERPWSPECRGCGHPPPPPPPPGGECPWFCRERPWSPECRACAPHPPGGECPWFCRERPWSPECRACGHPPPPPGGECPWFCRERPWSPECRFCRHDRAAALTEDSSTAGTEAVGGFDGCPIFCHRQPWLPQCRRCFHPGGGCPPFCRAHPFSPECRRRCGIFSTEPPAAATAGVDEKNVTDAAVAHSDEEEGAYFYCPFFCRMHPFLPMCRFRCGTFPPGGGYCPSYCRSHVFLPECGVAACLYTVAAEPAAEAAAAGVDEKNVTDTEKEEEGAFYCPPYCRMRPFLPECRYRCGGFPPGGAPCPPYCRYRPFLPECRRGCYIAVAAPESNEEGVKESAVKDEAKPDSSAAVVAAAKAGDEEAEGWDGECPWWCRERPWVPECRWRCGGGPPGGGCPWWCRERPWSPECRWRCGGGPPGGGCPWFCRERPWVPECRYCYM